MLSFGWLIPLSVCSVPLYPRGQRVFSHPSCSWLLPSPYSSFKTFVLQRRCRGRIWARLQSFLMVTALPLSQSVPAGTFSRYSHQSFLWVPSEVSGEESAWIPIISVAPGFYTVPLAHTWPLPINLLIILAESLLFLGVQLHQPKVRKYSHPTSACNHLSSLDLVSFSWLASWLPSNVSSLINLQKVVNMQVWLFVVLRVELFSPFYIPYINGKYGLLFYGVPLPFQKGVRNGVLENIFLEPSLI